MHECMLSPVRIACACTKAKTTVELHWLHSLAPQPCRAYISQQGSTRIVFKGQNVFPAGHCEGLARACLAICKQCDMEAGQGRVQQLGDAASLQHIALAAAGRQDAMEGKLAGDCRSPGC